MTSKNSLKLHAKRGFATGIKIIGKERKIANRLDKSIENYYCLLFYGFGVNEQKLIYALCVLDSCKVSNLYILIRVFLSITNNVCESLFISDQVELAEAVFKLK